jgi:hypothetical protein
MDDLQTQNITPLAVLSQPSDSYISSEIYIELPDDTPQETIDAINVIVAAHDPTPLPLPKTETEVLQERVDTLEFDNANLLLEVAGKQEQIDTLGMDNANLLLDSADKQIRIDALEQDNANILLDSADKQMKIDALEIDNANILLILATNNIM